MSKKTGKMTNTEAKLGGRPLEKVLPELINDKGFSETAKELKISKATLNYWMLKLGIQLKRVALAPGETIEIKQRL